LLKIFSRHKLSGISGFSQNFEKKFFQLFFSGPCPSKNSIASIFLQIIIFLFQEIYINYYLVVVFHLKQCVIPIQPLCIATN